MNNMLRLASLLFLAAFGISHQSNAQGYHIEATIKGVRDSSFVLGHYNRTGSQFIPKDTAKADANGHLVFEGKQTLPGGLYVILFPGNSRLIQYVYSGKETNFALETDTTDIIGHMKVTGSRENEQFYNYQKQIIETEKAIAALGKDGLATAQTQKLREDFRAYRQKFMKDNADTFTARIFQMSADPELPPAPKLANGQNDSTWIFNYYKNHYWDAFDFADARILRTPFFESKLDRYIKNLVVQRPDSLIKETDFLIGKATNEEVKAFVTYYIANQYENPKTVGTEDVWVHIAEKYYLAGKMDITEDSRKRIAEKVNTLKYLLVNKQFPALTLDTPAGKKVSVQAIPADYMVLFFYAPTCGHCKEASPVLKAFYDRNKDKGIKVMAISTEHNLDEWKAFVTKYELGELINGFDTAHQIDFNRKFDVVTTPTVYILDKNKKIIARKMPVDQIEDFLNYYKNRQAKKI